MWLAFANAWPMLAKTREQREIARPHLNRDFRDHAATKGDVAASGPTVQAKPVAVTIAGRLGETTISGTLAPIIIATTSLGESKICLLRSIFLRTASCTNA